MEAHGCHEPFRCASRGAARGGERAVTPQPGEVGRATSLLGGTATPAAHARRPPAREERSLGRANPTVPLPLPLPLPVTRTNPRHNPSAHPNHASWGWCAWLWVALRTLQQERPCRWKAAARPARPAASASKSPHLRRVAQQAKAQQAMQGYYAGVTHVDKQACCACAVHALCMCRVHVPCMRRACGVHAGRDAALPVRVGGPAAAGGACVGGPVGEDDRAPHVGPRVEAGRTRRVEQAHALRGGHARATHRAPSPRRRPRRGGRSVTARRGGAGRGGADRCDAQPA